MVCFDAQGVRTWLGSNNRLAPKRTLPKSETGFQGTTNIFSYRVFCNGQYIWPVAMIDMLGPLNAWLHHQVQIVNSNVHDDNDTGEMYNNMDARRKDQRCEVWTKGADEAVDVESLVRSHKDIPTCGSCGC
jgi:hypothetical protein